MQLNEAEDFLRDLFSEFADKPDLTDQRTLDKIITRSCKSAVKGGDVLDSREIAALIDQLKACENPFSCPHGRPTIVSMSKYEIEKKFKRIVT
jgi:DNA mismatch repair protein MutL